MRASALQVRAWCALLLAAATTPLGAQPARPTGASQVMQRGYAASSMVNVRVFVPEGRVRVQVWERDSIHVAGSIGATATMLGGGSREYVKFGVEPSRRGDTHLASADLVVMVPRRAQLWVKMTTGEIEAQGTAGVLELYAVGGRIRVRDASGVISIESIDADVTIESSSGDVRVRGGKAPLLLRDVGGTASLATVSGNVTMSGARLPECKVETIGGSIDVLGVLRGQTLELQTHSGAISMTVDPTRLPVLDLASRSGVVQWNNRSGSLKDGRIVARSFKGDISVRSVAK